jgi:hypothetical protein
MFCGGVEMPSSGEMALILGADELADLCGTRRAQRQRAWLEERAIPWREGSAGRIQT